VHISARSDYAVRAMLAIAGAAPALIAAPELAAQHRIPLGFLHGILAELRRSGLVHSQRGLAGGYTLARSAADISVGDVLRATSGTLTTVRGLPPDQGDYRGAARPLRHVWLATEEAIRDVVDRVSLADLLTPNPSAAPAPPPNPTHAI
jgi:Rrf2 family protein